MVTQATEVRLRRAESNARARPPRPSGNPAEHRLHRRPPKVQPTTQRRGGDPRRPAGAASCALNPASARPPRCPRLPLDPATKQAARPPIYDLVWDWRRARTNWGSMGSGDGFPPIAFALSRSLSPRLTTVAPNEAENDSTLPTHCNDKSTLCILRFSCSQGIYVSTWAWFLRNN